MCGRAGCGNLKPVSHTDHATLTWGTNVGAALRGRPSLGPNKAQNMFSRELPTIAIELPNNYHHSSSNSHYAKVPHDASIRLSCSLPLQHASPARL